MQSSKADTRGLGFRIDAKLYEGLDRVSRWTGLSKRAILEQALEQSLRQWVNFREGVNGLGEPINLKKPDFLDSDWAKLSAALVEGNKNEKQGG